MGAKKPLNLIFDVKTSKVEANDGALNKLEFLLSPDGMYHVKSGPAMRIIVDLGNVEGSESILPTGQSGNVFSPFYKNQAEMFVNGKYRGQL
ncbi:penicillin acylase family protein, partial [Arthrospira platensis SPKY2]